MQEETFLHLTTIQWAGLSAIATFLVSIIAMFLPFYIDRKKIKNKIKILEAEMKDNYKKLKPASESKDTTLNQGTKNITISTLDIQLAITEFVSLDKWIEFKFELASKDPKLFEKYDELMGLLQCLLKDREKLTKDLNQNKSLIPRFQNGITDFVEKYETTESAQKNHSPSNNHFNHSSK